MRLTAIYIFITSIFTAFSTVFASAPINLQRLDAPQVGQQVIDRVLSLGQLGTASLMLALGIIIYALIAGVLGITRRNAQLQTSARYAAVATFLALSTAIMCMEAALLTDDFTVQYVAQHSSVPAPLWVKVVMLWGALEGSILLWAWILSLYTAILAMNTPNHALRPWALNIMQFVQLFFVLVLAFVANPFTLNASGLFVGPGPNSLLQNHWMMAIHPILMYLGFVGLTVPFAFAMAALITKRPGSEWMRLTRRWTLMGWGFLTAAIIAGGWWSYEVLGWGGFWAWDPVENVSFMPWLTATAFIHGIQVQERRRMLKSWNMMLIVLTFTLSILGTFLTRSGVLSSIHAFGDGPVGIFFLIFFLLVLFASLGLVVMRWDQVRDHSELDAVVSRESSYLLGNVLFLAMTFMILLGTLFPLIVELFSGEKVTVGAPFFNQMSVPIFLAIFLLMGIGPLLPWRKAEHQSVIRNLLWMCGVGIIAAAIAYVLGIRRVYPLLTIAISGYNIASLGLLISAAVVPRARLSKRNSLQVFRQYAFENRRRFGSMIVHLGVIVTALGIMGASAYRIDEQVKVDFGTSTQFRSYELRAIDMFEEQVPGRGTVGANVEVWQNNRKIDTLRPRINVFVHDGVTQQQPVPTADVLYRVQHDVYLTLSGSLSRDQEFVILRVVQSPLVMWIWIGGFIMAFGTLYCVIPSASERRQERLAMQESSANSGQTVS